MFVKVATKTRKRDKREPLKELFKNSVKFIKENNIALTNKVRDGDTWTYYLDVGEHIVVIRVFNDGQQPYRKEFSCDCSHASLFGRDNNTPCKHIVAALVWFGLGELWK